MRLQHYDIKLEYRRGQENPADYLSRHPTSESSNANPHQKMAEDKVNFIAGTSSPVAITLDEVKDETKRDTTLQQVMSTVRTDRWYDATTSENTNSTSIAASDVSMTNLQYGKMLISYFETAV